LFFRAEFIVWRTSAFAVPAVVQGENIYARRGEPFRKSVLHLALAIALMKQQNARSWFAGIEIRGLQNDSVRRGEAYNSRRRRWLGRGRQQRQGEKNQDEKSSSIWQRITSTYFRTKAKLTALARILLSIDSGLMLA